MRNADERLVMTPWVGYGAAVMALVAAVAACDPGDPSAYASRSAALTGGSDAPTLVALTAGQHLALGAIVADEVVRCTGALVSERHMLIAAHCLRGEDDLARFEVVLAPELLAPERGDARGRTMAAVEAHASLDVALATLSEAVAGAEPFALATDPPDALLDHALEVAGAGLGSGGAMKFGVFIVTGVEPTRLRVAVEAPLGQCSGDSGGPWLEPWLDGARIVAVSSTSAPSCGGPAYGVRADVLAAWVDEVVARRSAPAPIAERIVVYPHPRHGAAPAEPGDPAVEAMGCAGGPAPWPLIAIAGWLVASCRHRRARGGTDRARNWTRTGETS